MFFPELIFAAGEPGDHGYELARADRFGDVHLVPSVERLFAIFVARVGGQSRCWCSAAFVMRERSDAIDKTVTIFVRHPDVAEDDVRPPGDQLRQRFTRAR